MVQYNTGNGLRQNLYPLRKRREESTNQKNKKRKKFQKWERSATTEFIQLNRVLIRSKEKYLSSESLFCVD